MSEAAGKPILTLREIDRLIAERIFGVRPCKEWKPANLGSAGGPVLIHGDWMKPVKHEYECYPDIEDIKTIQGTLGGPARYTTDIAAAWQLVEKMRERGFGVLIACGAEVSKYEVEITPAQSEYAKGERRIVFTEATAQLAICLAALKAYGLDIAVAT